MEPTFDASPLFAEWQRLAAQGLTHRSIAARLGLSEAELVASGCGRNCTRLVTDARRLFEAAKRIGRVKVVVRNDYAVMERPGAIRRVRSDGTLLRIEGSSFRLVVDTGQLGSAFALEEERRGGSKRSIALYDRAGTSVLKLVLQQSSRIDAYERLCRVLRYREPAGAADTAAEHAVPARREHADTASLAGFLVFAAEAGLPLRITVRSDAASLEAESVLRRVKRSARAPWINVLDSTLDLHLFEAEIALLAVERAGAGAVLHWLSAQGIEAFSVAVGADCHRCFGPARSNLAG